jgi:Ser/Thr protein kinase RdoA (MazF antagonist)
MASRLEGLRVTGNAKSATPEIPGSHAVPDDAVAGVLREYRLCVKGIERVTAGHINLTYRVEADEGSFALQRLHPAFGPEVHHDIEAVTAHLAARGVETPRLVRTRAGDLWAAGADRRPWRVLTWIPGNVVLAAASPAQCAAAGACLGRMHAALCAHADHGHLAKIEPLAAQIQSAAEGLVLPADLPLRIVHGDPKISNFVFAPDGTARTMIDLDTFSHMALPLELGDALRSWCNPRGEESGEPVDVEHFRAAIEAYAETIGELPTRAERQAIPRATALIAIELAARFATDALEESYFAWDRSRFVTAAEHNLHRARAQLALARSVVERMGMLKAIVGEVWRS